MIQKHKIISLLLSDCLMMAKEQFCLRWNEFESSISNSFRELKEAGDFFDVTLVCQDRQVEAHKVILSACSPFFKAILKKNPHPHPLLYLKDIMFEHMEALLEFMYQGEVKVPQEELGPFLAVAEELKVKGLTQSVPHPPSGRPAGRPVGRPTEGTRQTSEPLALQSGQDQIQKHPGFAPKPVLTSNPGGKEHSDNVAQHRELALVKPEYGEESFTEETGDKGTSESGYMQADSMDDRWGEGMDHQDPMTMADVDGINAINRENIENCIRRTEDNTYQCVACGKVCATKTALVNHVENQHYPGHYACTICHAVFKSRGSLNTHHQRHHKAGPFQAIRLQQAAGEASPLGPQRPLMLNLVRPGDNPPPPHVNLMGSAPQHPRNPTPPHVNIMGAATLQKF